MKYYKFGARAEQIIENYQVILKHGGLAKGKAILKEKITKLQPILVQQNMLQKILVMKFYSSYRRV